MLLQEAQSDWLASKNIFYNTRSNKISDNINDLIESEDIEFDKEGLYNYLDYGYSAFGQTPLRNIKILEPNRNIRVENGKIQIKELPDLFEQDLGKRSGVDDTLEYLHTIINEKIKERQEDIIVPTSGGFDSRIINSMIEEKAHIHSYTYGTSERQEESFEVVYAKKLCEILNIKWEQIELNDYIQFIDDWNAVFGISTHAHGMYQMEFYAKIRNRIGNHGIVVSGIYGDLWAGNWKFKDILCSEDLESLSIHHGQKLDMSCCKLKCSHDLRDEYFEKMRYKLKDDNWKIIAASRMKIVLLSYLLRIPEYYGFKSWSPFLDYGAVIRMINLDWTKKEHRKWQIEYFKKKGVLIGELNLPCNKDNCLDYMVVKSSKFEPLDVELLGSIVEKSYLEKVNRALTDMTKDTMNCYRSYQVLYPVQKILQIKER